MCGNSHLRNIDIPTKLNLFSKFQKLRFKLRFKHSSHCSFQSKIVAEYNKIKRQRCIAIAEDERPTRKLCRHASEDSRSRAGNKQNTLGKTGSESQIKQTSSLELEQHDDYAYWKSNQSVRRLNSNSIPMETHLMTDHPQSLEIISNKEDSEKNISSHPQSLEVAPFSTFFNNPS